MGTQRNLCPKRLMDITFSHHRATDVLQMPEVMPKNVPLPPTSLFCTQDELREGLKHLQLPVSSLLHKCLSAVQGQEPGHPASSPHADHDGTNNCQRCMLFYDRFVAIDPNKCTASEHVTLEQSSSHLWHDSRKVVRLESLRAQQRRFPSEAILRPLSESTSTPGSMEMQQLTMA